MKRAKEKEKKKGARRSSEKGEKKKTVRPPCDVHLKRRSRLSPSYVFGEALVCLERGSCVTPWCRGQDVLYASLLSAVAELPSPVCVKIQIQKEEEVGFLCALLWFVVSHSDSHDERAGGAGVREAFCFNHARDGCTPRIVYYVSPPEERADDRPVIRQRTHLVLLVRQSD